nr:MAG TPA: hypothetical protein [Caudoviricetes sp.]
MTDSHGRIDGEGHETVRTAVQHDHHVTLTLR